MGLLLMSLLAPLHAEPEVSIRAGADARVEQVPRVQSQVIELFLRDVTEDITPLRQVRTPQIEEIDVRSYGGGDWMLRAYLVDPETHLVPEVTDGMLSLSVEPGTTPVRPPIPDAPTLEALFTEEVQSSPPETLPSIFFLHGDAMSGRLEPREYPLRFGEPDWLQDDPGLWPAIEDARLAYLRADDCGPRCAGDGAQAMHELGWRYLRMGWNIEGRHYLYALPPDNPTIIDPLTVARGQARAAIAAQDWDAAREYLARAWALGEPTPDVVEALGIVSLASGAPARGPTGRLLANVNGGPHAQLLAAQLLQLDDQFEETVAILAPLPDLFTDAGDLSAASQASLRLGDALLVGGNFDTAVGAWDRVDEPMRTFRMVYAELFRMDSWVQAIPYLQDQVKSASELGPEALYLIAQIDQKLGIDVDAIEGYVRLIDDYPRTAQLADMAERLWTLYANRVHRLESEGEWYAIAALHEAAWRDALYDQMDDPTVLWDVARAYDALGLPRQALAALNLGHTKLVSEGQSNPEMVLYLAHLYEHLENDRDGLKTLDFLRESGVPDDMESEVAMMSGRMLLNVGELAAATLELQRARRDPAFRQEADLILALNDAKNGRCNRAIAPLQELLLSEEGLERWTDPLPYLELTRCAADAERFPLAADAAAAAAERSSSPAEVRYANYLQQLYRNPDRVDDTMAEGEDIWSALSRERAASAAFEEALNTRLD